MRGEEKLEFEIDQKIQRGSEEKIQRIIPKRESENVSDYFVWYTIANFVQPMLKC